MQNFHIGGDDDVIDDDDDVGGDDDDGGDEVDGVEGNDIQPHCVVPKL